MRRSAWWLGAPGLALAASMAPVALGSVSPERVLDIVPVSIIGLLIWGLATVVRHRYPERPLWLLLVALGVIYPLQNFVISSHAPLYTLARAARPLVEVLLVWLMVAFPTGSLMGRRDRVLVIASFLAVLLLWLPAMMFSPQIPLAGPLVSCGSECPENLLFVADRPDQSAFFFHAFRFVGVTILIATTLHLYLRLRQATTLMRRSVGPVLLASILRTLSVAGFLLAGGGRLIHPATLVAILAGIGFGLLSGRMYAARALQKLVTGLRHRPAIRELRDVMADALEDPSLELGFWDSASHVWRDSTGRELRLADNFELAMPDGRVVRMLRDESNRPVAVLVHDAALIEEPMLLDAITSSMHGVLVHHQIEAALADERFVSARAVESERRRIERDLHDGSQQRLLALRLKLSVTKRLIDKDSSRATELLAEMGRDIDEVLGELRAVSHGIAPPLLVEQGLTAALGTLARHAAIEVTYDLQDVGRCDATIEGAVYFCVSEALQNAVKHAGEAAHVRLSLAREGDHLRFSVEDDGPGLSAPPGDGQGLANMVERLRAVGGELSFENHMPRGLEIQGCIVAPAS